MRRGLRFIVLLQGGLKVLPFADVFTKAAFSPQLFKDPECWSGSGLNFAVDCTVNFQYIIVSIFYQVQTRSSEFGILLFSQDQQVL